MRRAPLATRLEDQSAEGLNEGVQRDQLGGAVGAVGPDRLQDGVDLAVEERPGCVVEWLELPLVVVPRRLELGCGGRHAGLFPGVDLAERVRRDRVDLAMSSAGKFCVACWGVSVVSVVGGRTFLGGGRGPVWLSVGEGEDRACSDGYDGEVAEHDPFPFRVGAGFVRLLELDDVAAGDGEVDDRREDRSEEDDAGPRGAEAEAAFRLGEGEEVTRLRRVGE